MTAKALTPALAGFMLSAMVAASPAKAQDAQSAVNDSTFVHMAASGGAAEVQAGKLAQQKASSADVKQFGQQMVTDHTNANKQLAAASQNAGLTPPTTMLPKHQQEVQQLMGMSGAAFDKAYMAAMVKDHTEMVQLFQQQARSGQAESLKQVAAQTLPVLQQHLTMAKQVAGQVGVDTTTAGTAQAERSQ